MTSGSKRRFLPVLVGVCVGMTAGAASARADEGPCTISWAGDQSGAWDVAANWTPARVPTSTDDACIDRGAADPTITVTTFADVHSLHSTERVALTAGQLYVRTGSDITAAALDVSGGQLSVDDALDLTGPANWTGGILAGGTIRSSGLFVAGGTTDLTLASRLETSGTLRVQTPGTLRVVARRAGALRRSPRRGRGGRRCGSPGPCPRPARAAARRSRRPRRTRRSCACRARGRRG
jgi:hypothetical protein